MDVFTCPCFGGFSTITVGLAGEAPLDLAIIVDDDVDKLPTYRIGASN